MHEPRHDWRRWLRWKIGWLLAFKLVALIVLWLLFFSPDHRVDVDAGVMSQRVAPAGGARTDQPTPKPQRDDSGDV